MHIAKIEFGFYHSEDGATTRMHFNFFAKSRTAKEGDWEAADPTSKNLALIYFGDAEGWWNMVSEKSGVKQMLAMLEFEFVTGIRSLWHLSTPDPVALVYDVPKLPFQLGNFGDGGQWAQPGLRFNWKVIGI